MAVLKSRRRLRRELDRVTELLLHSEGALRRANAEIDSLYLAFADGEAAPPPSPATALREALRARDAEWLATSPLYGGDPSLREALEQRDQEAASEQQVQP